MDGSHENMTEFIGYNNDSFFLTKSLIESIEKNADRITRKLYLKIKTYPVSECSGESSHCVAGKNENLYTKWLSGLDRELRNACDKLDLIDKLEIEKQETKGS